MEGGGGAASGTNILTEVQVSLRRLHPTLAVVEVSTLEGRCGAITALFLMVTCRHRHSLIVEL